MTPGQLFTTQRQFTKQDVELFSQLSGDYAEHHQQPNPQGQLMVHGLLTSTLPTSLGKTLNYLVRESFSEYLRPVFTEQEIICHFQITETQPHKRGTWVRATFECLNPEGKAVMKGWTTGLVLSPIHSEKPEKKD